jgi:hypothetical protein
MGFIDEVHAENVYGSPIRAQRHERSWEFYLSETGFILDDLPEVYNQCETLVNNMQSSDSQSSTGSGRPARRLGIFLGLPDALQPGCLVEWNWNTISTGKGYEYDRQTSRYVRIYQTEYHHQSIIGLTYDNGKLLYNGIEVPFDMDQRAGGAIIKDNRPTQRPRVDYIVITDKDLAGRIAQYIDIDVVEKAMDALRVSGTRNPTYHSLTRSCNILLCFRPPTEMDSRTRKMISLGMPPFRSIPLEEAATAIIEINNASSNIRIISESTVDNLIQMIRNMATIPANGYPYW